MTFELTDEQQPLITGCYFHGDPPEGFTTWQKWGEALFSSKVLRGVYISAIQPEWLGVGEGGNPYPFPIRPEDLDKR